MLFFPTTTSRCSAEQPADSKLFTSGWGGRLADLANAFNENNKISMSISLAGQNSFQVGKNVTQYAVSPNGVIQPNGGGGNIGALRARPGRVAWHGDENLFQSAFAGLTTTPSSMRDALLRARQGCAFQD